MHPLVAIMATAIITYTAWLIGTHARRIKDKFFLDEYTHLTDLTRGDLFRQLNTMRDEKVGDDGLPV